MTTRAPLRRRTWTTLAAAVLFLAACGGQVAAPPASEGEPQDSPAPSGSTPASDGGLSDVYAQVEGLTGDERRDALIDLAMAEGGSVTLYSAVNSRNLEPVIEAFEADTGVRVDVLASSDLLARILQEWEAGVVGADVIQDGNDVMTLLGQDGVLSDLQTPFADDIVEAGVNDTWIASDMYVFLVAWNTDLVAESDVPTSYADLFTRFPGQYAIDSSDWLWFATLVNEYFVGQEGMTEEEAIALVTESVPGASVMADHTLGSELLAAGDYPTYPVMFHHYLPRFEEANAPIAWQPAVEPLIAGFTGIGVASNSDNPAGALLLTEYQLSDAQQIYADAGRTVTNVNYQTGGLDASLEIFPLDDAIANDPEQREKWEGIWLEIVQATGSEPIEGE